MVAAISNGTAVLGLGNIGALAGKPVMEGQVALFKRFADVDGIDLEVDTENVEEFGNFVCFLGPSFDGINLDGRDRRADRQSRGARCERDRCVMGTKPASSRCFVAVP